MTVLIVFIGRAYAGSVSVADAPRQEARASIAALKKLGIARLIMFTGDNTEVAEDTAKALAIPEFRAGMSPEEKLRELEALSEKHVVVMVGDGVNDAPALSRANVGIAMGTGGTAVAVQAADVVILSDDLSRLPELITLGRKTKAVIRDDSIIWFITNLFGFALVWWRFLGPTLAAVYNFATDFFPLINSTRLFGGRGRWREKNNERVS